MEIVVGIIMLLVVLAFVLKLSFHAWSGVLATAAVAALFTGMLWDEAAGQSKTQIADWLERPELMLDTSVLLTVDVLAQIAFCALLATRMAGAPMSRVQRVLYGVLLWVPGLLIFPVLFSMLVELIFSFPGVDFAVLGWSAAAGVLVLAPALAWGMKALLPESDMRLELLFLFNTLIACLGVVATVNGRTAVKAAGAVEWSALGAVAALLVAGAAAGLVLYKRYNRKFINNIK